MRYLEPLSYLDLIMCFQDCLKKQAFSTNQIVAANTAVNNILCFVLKSAIFLSRRRARSRTAFSLRPLALGIEKTFLQLYEALKNWP